MKIFKLLLVSILLFLVAVTFVQTSDTTGDIPLVVLAHLWSEEAHSFLFKKTDWDPRRTG